MAKDEKKRLVLAMFREYGCGNEHFENFQCPSEIKSALFFLFYYVPNWNT